MLCIKMVLYVFHNNEVHFPALAFLDSLYTPSQISLHYISLCLLSFVVQTQTFVKLFSLDWLFWERSDIRHIITLSSTVFGGFSGASMEAVKQAFIGGICKNKKKKGLS